jgi:hypothetical protein
MPSSSENPSSDYKLWYGIILFLIVCVTIFLIVIYIQPGKVEQQPKPTTITLQGKLAPLTSQDMISVGVGDTIRYRYIIPVDPYNELYVLHTSSTLYQNYTVYAKEKIVCSGEVKFSALDASVVVQSEIINTYKYATNVEHQIVIETWNCIK